MGVLIVTVGRKRTLPFRYGSAPFSKAALRERTFAARASSCISITARRASKCSRCCFTSGCLDHRPPKEHAIQVTSQRSVATPKRTLLDEVDILVPIKARHQKWNGRHRHFALRWASLRRNRCCCSQSSTFGHSQALLTRLLGASRAEEWPRRPHVNDRIRLWIIAYRLAVQLIAG